MADFVRYKTAGRQTEMSGGFFGKRESTVFLWNEEAHQVYPNYYWLDLRVIIILVKRMKHFESWCREVQVMKSRKDVESWVGYSGRGRRNGNALVKWRVQLISFAASPTLDGFR